jgi:hypothetical protein
MKIDSKFAININETNNVTTAMIVKLTHNFVRKEELLFFFGFNVTPWMRSSKQQRILDSSQVGKKE